MNTTDFGALFRSGNIGKLTLKNRLIMAPMGNSLADEKGCVTDAVLDYYLARARGGVGLIVTQCVSVNREDMMPYSLSLHDDSFIPGMEKLVRAVHEHDVKIIVQLMHPGMLLTLLPSLPPDMTVKVPSVVPLMAAGKPYHDLEKDDILHIIKNFGNAARRVMQTGADGVEIHACHGCLLSTFLSPLTNRRTDEYAGSPENRARFTLDVIAEVKQQTATDFPVTVRINGNDDFPGGITPDEVVRQSELMQEAGVDAVGISAGLEYWTTLMAPPVFAPEGVNLPVAAMVKNKLHIPVIVAGKITPELAARAVGESKADFIALGRPLLADPELPVKLQTGRAGEIRRCVYCNNCLKLTWRSCTVNPFLFREGMLPLPSANNPKNIMVVGGGIAGMQAAILLAEKGHRVVLYEKQAELGGQWRIASCLPEKSSYKNFSDYLIHRMEQLKIPVRLGIEATKDRVLEEKPDAVVIATGAVPKSIDIPGQKSGSVVQANDVLLGKAPVSGSVVVIGGNMLGMELAVFLAGQSVKVTLLSHGRLGGRKGPDDTIAFRTLMRKLAEFHVPVYANVKPVEVKTRSLAIEMDKEILSLPADTIVVAVGVASVSALADELAGSGPEVFAIGDCVVPGNAAQATYSAARLVSQI